MARRFITDRIDFLLSREKGTIYKDPGGRISICLVYPNTYHIGMSNLGFQGIYTLLNERPDVVCERAFLPEDDVLQEYRRTGSEIISLESRRPLNRFDILAFSVSFENDYPNILRILEMSRIPFRSAQRGGRHPLLIMGGACAFFNPEPLAEFFDICFVGEAEEMLPEFLDACMISRDRDKMLRKVMHMSGLYVPKFYNISFSEDGRILEQVPLNGAPHVVQKRFVRDISAIRLRPTIITPEMEFSDMYLTEAMRGCPWNCRFCVAGFVYKPARSRHPMALEEEVRRGQLMTSRIGLIAPSLSDCPHIEEALSIDGVDFSITSLRASQKSAGLVRFLKGHRSVSIAPEAGTERLRKAIDKRISRENILETSRLILSGGIETLRLYFMVGLPTEVDADIEGIVSLVREIRHAAPQGNISLTVSTFVPKPWTPFQWHPMEQMDVVKKRLRFIKKELLPVRGVKVFHDVPKYAYMQGLFSLGDRRISMVLEEMLKTEDWRKSCIKAQVNVDSYLFRQKGRYETLPWDFIDVGSSKERLWSEYQKALSSGE